METFNILLNSTILTVQIEAFSTFVSLINQVDYFYNNF